MAHLTGQDLLDQQADILAGNLSTNPELPSSPIPSQNNALQTQYQTVIGAINELLAGLKANNATVQNFDIKVNDALGNTITDPTLMQNIQKIDTNALKAIYTLYLDLNGGDELVDISAIGSSIKGAILNLQNEINTLNGTVSVVTGFRDHNVINDSNPTIILLSFQPTTTKEVVLYINGVDYEENNEFTVNRTTRTITWVFTSINGGFDLDDTLDIYSVYDYSK
jgi:hypothetical protein